MKEFLSREQKADAVMNKMIGRGCRQCGGPLMKSGDLCLTCWSIKLGKEIANDVLRTTINKIKENI